MLPEIKLLDPLQVLVQHVHEGAVAGNPGKPKLSGTADDGVADPARPSVVEAVHRVVQVVLAEGDGPVLAHSDDGFGVQFQDLAGGVVDGVGVVIETTVLIIADAAFGPGPQAARGVQAQGEDVVAVELFFAAAGVEDGVVGAVVAVEAPGGAHPHVTVGILCECLDVMVGDMVGELGILSGSREDPCQGQAE